MNAGNGPDNPNHSAKELRPLYHMRPDYSRPMLHVAPEAAERIRRHLEFLYGPEEADRWLPEFKRLLKVHHAHKSPELIAWEERHGGRDIFTEKDMVAITYGDMVRDGGGAPLQQLMRFCNEVMLAPNTLHVLPFFPYSSDRGFAVVDFTRVDPKLGDWNDIRALAGRYCLMFDGVLNHVSSHSRMFQDFLDGRPEAQDFFIAYDSPDDLTPDQRSKIFRPRTSDILTKFDTYHGRKYLWTTFSDDQIDLNYRNPAVLAAALEALLLYTRMGADLLRLDAVTYIWAEPGTECVHLAQTHEIVKLIRTTIDLAAPGTAVLTETNVPHADNVAYFGNGLDEAHMVYNFALPPLVLHALFSGDARTLGKWAAALKAPSDQTHFFNMLDTHDGIGLMGAKGILDADQIGLIVREARRNGALVSYKSVAGGAEEPYEINSTWWSVLDRPDDGYTLEQKVKRYCASRSIHLALKGVPAVYLHGALGSENDWQTYERTGQRRDLNRAYINMSDLAAQIEDPRSKLTLMVRHMRGMQINRVGNRAFHPKGGQEVLDMHPGVLALLRTSPQGRHRIVALTNVRDEAVSLEIPLSLIGESAVWRDTLGGGIHQADGDILKLTLEPYGVQWLQPAA